MWWWWSLMDERVMITPVNELVMINPLNEMVIITRVYKIVMITLVNEMVMITLIWDSDYHVWLSCVIIMCVSDNHFWMIGWQSLSWMRRWSLSWICLNLCHPLSNMSFNLWGLILRNLWGSILRDICGLIQRLNPLLNPSLYSPNHSLFLRITLRHLLRCPQRLSSEILQERICQS